MKFEKVFIDGSGRIANDDIRDEVRDEIHSRKGQHVDIVIEEHHAGPRRRTLDQNAYLHAEPFPKIAKHLGESVARTKLILMGEFWGYEPVTTPSGVRVFIPAKIHTSDMTVEETTTFIDWLLPWALEKGIDVEMPSTWMERQRRAA